MSPGGEFGAVAAESGHVVADDRPSSAADSAGQGGFLKRDGGAQADDFEVPVGILTLVGSGQGEL